MVLRWRLGSCFARRIYINRTLKHKSSNSHFPGLTNIRRRLSYNLSLVISVAPGFSFYCCSLVVSPLSSLFSLGLHFSACAWCAAAASRMLPHRISGTAVWSFNPIRASRLLLKPLCDLGIIHRGYRGELLIQASVAPKPREVWLRLSQITSIRLHQPCCYWLRWMPIRWYSII